MQDESRAAATTQTLHPSQPPSTELLLQVVQYVMEHLHLDLAASALSKKFALNERSLLEGFQLHTGMALDEYVLRRRIERALDLMKNSKASDSEIAVQIGVGAASVFRSVFSEYLGLSPAEYRRSLTRYSRLRMPGDNDAVNGV